MHTCIQLHTSIDECIHVVVVELYASQFEARLLTALGGVGSCLRGACGILLFLGHRAGQGAAQVVTKRSAQPFKEVEGAIELLEHDQFLKVYFK